MKVTNHQLEDWQQGVQATIGCDVDLKPQRIDITFANRACISVEYEDGHIRAHCYRSGEDEPLSVTLMPHRIEVQTPFSSPLPISFLVDEEQERAEQLLGTTTEDLQKQNQN